MGVREYFAYDPNRPAVWGKKEGGGRRLLGWWYDATGTPVEITPDARGWL
jgi:hypothetical protein